MNSELGVNNRVNSCTIERKRKKEKEIVATDPEELYPLSHPTASPTQPLRQFSYYLERISSYPEAINPVGDR